MRWRTKHARPNPQLRPDRHCPLACEAAIVEGVEAYPASTVSQAVSFVNEQIELDPYELDGQPYTLSQLNEALDFADVRGQEAVKRAIAISASRGHDLLML